MSIISKCPKCHAQVTIPEGLGPEREVRCPLCVAVYPLGEALAEAPPALIPVDTGVIPGPDPDSAATAASEPIAEQSRLPESRAEAELWSAATQAPEADLEPAGEAAPGLETRPKVDVAPEIDTGGTEGASLAIDTGQTPVDAAALAAFGLKAAEDEYQSAAGSQAIHPRRRNKEKSAVRFLVEVFAGGLLGLAIGYYVLCWVLGPQSGLPKLPLPLLPHTMHWFSGAQQPGNSAQRPGNSAQRPGAGQPPTSKRPAEVRPRQAPPRSEQNSPLQTRKLPHGQPSIDVHP
jgi:hypothetical protein